jgi:hypothetical protein
MSRNLDGQPIEQILREAASSSELVIAWYSIGPRIIKCEMHIKGVRRRRKELCLVPVVGQEYYLDQIISGQDSVKIYLPIAALFFSSHLIGLNSDGELLISMPYDYQFRERRQVTRIVPDLPVRVTIGVGHSSITTNCNDLGTNGFSLLLAKKDRHVFHQGAHLNGVIVNIGDSKLNLDVLVIGVLKLKPYQLERFPYADVRVAFSFQALQTAQLGVLDKFIASYIQVG